QSEPLMATGSYLFWSDPTSQATLGYDVAAQRQLRPTQPWNLSHWLSTDGRTLAWIDSRPDPTTEGATVHSTDLQTGREAAGPRRAQLAAALRRPGPAPGRRHYDRLRRIQRARDQRRPPVLDSDSGHRHRRANVHLQHPHDPGAGSWRGALSVCRRRPSGLVD